MSAHWSIDPLDPKCEKDIEAIALLHSTCLPESPVSRLGHRFMAHFYYRYLTEGDLIRCLLFRYQGVAVGFVAYTVHPNNFMGRGARCFFPTLLLTLLKTFAESPRRLFIPVEVIGELFQRKALKVKQGMAEILSIGVLPTYRKEILRPEETKISALLFDRMIQELKDQACTSLRVITKKNNKESQKFYLRRGLRTTVEQYSRDSLLLSFPSFLKTPEQ